MRYYLIEVSDADYRQDLTDFITSALEADTDTTTTYVVSETEVVVKNGEPRDTIKTHYC